MCDLFHVSLYFEEDILKQNRKSGSKVKIFFNKGKKWQISHIN